MLVSCRSSCSSPLCGPSGVATVLEWLCAKLCRKTLFAHFNPVLSAAQPLDLLPPSLFSAGIWRLILSNVLRRHNVWFGSHLVAVRLGSSCAMSAGKIKSCLLPLRQKYFYRLSCVTLALFFIVWQYRRVTKRGMSVRTRGPRVFVRNTDLSPPHGPDGKLCTVSLSTLIRIIFGLSLCLSSIS